nr:hypothetical protein [Odoribacter splanchnicus]
MKKKFKLIIALSLLILAGINLYTITEPQANRTYFNIFSIDNKVSATEWFWDKARRESIMVTCHIRKEEETRTYYDVNGNVVGTAVYRGGQLISSVGVTTGSYRSSYKTVEVDPFQATRVNCPTDEERESCTPYDPCF